MRPIVKVLRELENAEIDYLLKRGWKLVGRKAREEDLDTYWEPPVDLRDVLDDQEQHQDEAVRMQKYADRRLRQIGTPP